MSRISEKQRRVLTVIADACVPQSMGIMEPKRVVPLCTMQLPDIFNSDAEERRFVANLEGRRLIRTEKSHFLYITDEGLRALGRPVADGVKEGGNG